MRTQDGLISVGTMVCCTYFLLRTENTTASATATATTNNVYSNTHDNDSDHVVVFLFRWLKVMVDLLLLFGGYATVFLVSPKRNNAGISGVNGAAPGSLARLEGRVKHEGDDPYGRGGGSGGSGGGGVPLGNDEGARTAAGLADGDGLDDLSLSSVSSTLASFFLFLAILRIMAPVLRTLTVSYSDDTIYALAVTLSFLHLAFHDYSYANTSSSGHFQARGTLSLNAAIFAAVLLASRLESNEKVFGLVLFALELFAFFPLARREVKRHSLLLHASVTSAMVLPTGLLLYLRHPTLFTAYLGTVVLVTVACPLWLLRVQRYKLRIEGPWDIAHVEAHP
ncbi:unnamed protein product [Ectocarpus sp. 12 AP-2014]